MARGGTAQNLALRKAGTKKHVATKMRIVYVNHKVILIKMNECTLVLSAMATYYCKRGMVIHFVAYRVGLHVEGTQ
jgi:S-adenosylmethionine hydrolase